MKENGGGGRGAGYSVTEIYRESEFPPTNRKGGYFGLLLAEVIIRIGGLLPVNVQLAV